MPDHPTPDVERLPLRFDPPPDHRLRTSVGSSVLVGGALTLGSRLARRIPADRMRSLERSWAHSVRRALRLTISCSGLSGVDTSRPHVVMPLHESFVDVPVVLHLPLSLRFVVREELLGFPSMGRYLAASDQLPVPEDPRVRDLRALADRVGSVMATGESVVVFPQGSVLGIESAFQGGTGWLARRLGVPILPIVISGTHRVWDYPFDTTVHFDRTVELHALEAIPPGRADPAHLRSIERRMKQMALTSPHPPRRYVPDRDGWWDGYRFAIDPDFGELAEAVDARRNGANRPT